MGLSLSLHVQDCCPDLDKAEHEWDRVTRDGQVSHGSIALDYGHDNWENDIIGRGTLPSIYTHTRTHQQSLRQYASKEGKKKDMTSMMSIC